MIVSSRDILKIKNPNLGYRIDYLLNEFRNDSEEGFVSYSGFPLFIQDSSLSKRKLRRAERNRPEAYHGSLQHLIKSVYYGRTMAVHAGKYIDSVENEPITSMAIRKNRDRREYLEFSNYIPVTYLKEGERLLYVTGIQRRARNSQASRIRMTVDSTKIFENGSLFDPLGLVVEGYIGWERFGDMLPTDYNPETD